MALLGGGLRLLGGRTSLFRLDLLSFRRSLRRLSAGSRRLCLLASRHRRLRVLPGLGGERFCVGPRGLGRRKVRVGLSIRRLQRLPLCGEIVDVPVGVLQVSQCPTSSVRSPQRQHAGNPEPDHEEQQRGGGPAPQPQRLAVLADILTLQLVLRNPVDRRGQVGHCIAESAVPQVQVIL